MLAVPQSSSAEGVRNIDLSFAAAAVGNEEGCQAVLVIKSDQRWHRDPFLLLLLDVYFQIPPQPSSTPPAVVVARPNAANDEWLRLHYHIHGLGYFF